MQNLKRSFPWLIAGVVILSSLLQAINLLPLQIPADAAPTEIRLFISLLIALSLVSITFSVVGALILTRKPGHLVGWLLLISAISNANPTSSILEIYFPAAPTALSPGLWLLLWLDGWAWLLGILPIFLILLNFPTGSPPSQRWRWLNFLAPGMILYSAVENAFLKDIGPGHGLWQVENPIGFIPEELFFVLGFPFYAALLTLAVSSVVAIILRSRRAVGVERLQIRWLLSSAALCLVALGILIWVFAAGMENTSRTFGPYLLVFLSFLTLPISIAFAILRYRLYDIDIIIRRTLSYSILSAVLGLVYFGGVVLLQNIFGGLFGRSELPLITVISTLVIAALFNPLRGRIQEFIDRRFFRTKYDAEKALIDFAAVSRDEVDIVRLSGSLLMVVESTMQPEYTSLWLKDSAERK